ncbi:MAG: MBL fold metallo-hydrolase [Pyrinomonadaceae bacterium]|nr:MBL fold metallo-hydrolase [Pyrinomonadaceae bacterium]
MKNDLKITMIGGPTILLEIDGLRFLTDPTFDAAGSEYVAEPFALKKLTDPAVPIDSVGRVDAVLLSHEQHADNLDTRGRAFTGNAKTILTTPESAAVLGGNAIGLKTWETFEFDAASGRKLQITATPARHGPAGSEAMSGTVTGFLLNWKGDSEDAVYISGDTVWFEGTAETAKRFNVGTAILFLGAVRFEQAGEMRFTMNASEAVQAAQAFESATIIPAHYEGWAHFQEPRETVEKTFAEAGKLARLRWLELGVETSFDK